MPHPDPLYQATAAEVRAGRRGARFWAWLRKWRRRLKLVVEVGGLLAAMGAASVKAWLLLKARDVGRAELPANGVASTFEDRAPPRSAGK